MDLQVISTGKKFYKIDSGVGAILLELFPANLRCIGSSDVARWFRTPEWRNLRSAIIFRDPTCKCCGKRPSTHANHIRPHDGNFQKFLDPSSLIGTCAICHAKGTPLPSTIDCGEVG